MKYSLNLKSYNSVKYFAPSKHFTDMKAQYSVKELIITTPILYIGETEVQRG